MASNSEEPHPAALAQLNSANRGEHNQASDNTSTNPSNASGTTPISGDVGGGVSGQEDTSGVSIRVEFDGSRYRGNC